MYNKKAESDILKIVVIVAVGLLIANLVGVIDLSQYIGTSSEKPSVDLTDEATKNCPTTGTTTYTINVQDALTSTATNVDAEYFIFNGNKLIKEGTTGSDGTVDVDVTCGKDYKLLLVNTTAGLSNGLYQGVYDLKARISADTLNAKLYDVGSGKILGIENPADPSGNANVSLTAGATKNFDLKFVANSTEDGFNKPIIMCEANVTEISSINLASFSDGTTVKEVTSLPKRLSPSSGQQYYAWEYPKILTPNMGVVTASGNLVVSGSVTPAATSDMTCILIDQATWKSSDYKTASSIDEGFKIGPENTETLADTGGPDSTTSSYTFTHSGGY
jgi:hypothetical protein